ncbi:hypothetical protein GCM10023194_07670 [Planotetraspora phitsanulokensis]
MYGGGSRLPEVILGLSAYEPAVNDIDDIAYRALIPTRSYKSPKSSKMTPTTGLQAVRGPATSPVEDENRGKRAKVVTCRHVQSHTVARLSGRRRPRLCETTPNSPAAGPGQALTLVLVIVVIP